jgi:hypothetical protein
MKNTPYHMEVAALVIGIIALLVSLVTLPSAFQMFWGGPKLYFDFLELDGSDVKRLYCSISSVPIQNRTLQRLGVRRESAVVSAKFRICEAGSNRIVLDTAQAKLVAVGNPEDRGSIVTTVHDPLFGVTFDCAFHDNDRDHAVAIDPFKKTVATLLPGRYRVDIDVLCGHKLFSRWREMTVGTRPDHTYWLSASNRK